MNLETEVSHELWAAVRRSYESQAWSNAILDGVYYMSDLIRSRTGLQSDGTALAGQAFGGKAPKLRLNRLQTDSEKSIQSGIEQLVRGLYQAIRNPRSHERVNDARADADALIVFIDYLIRLIGHAKTAFSLDEAVERILDENFVPNERYAELVVEEIPQRERLTVALTVFERLGSTDPRQLAVFFQSILRNFSVEDRAAFFSALSEVLREGSDDAMLRAVLQILQPDQWAEISEVARLRSENRLLASFKSGRYNPDTKECLSGGLATWCMGFWQHFSLKKEFLVAASELVSSLSRQARGYLFQFAFHRLDSLADSPPRQLELALILRIKKRDAVAYEHVKGGYAWDESSWSDAVKKALADYEAAGAEAAGEDDGIPF